MVTGPTNQQFSPEFQKEIDDAVEHIERQLESMAPSTKGLIRFSMKKEISGSLRGVLKRKYEGAGWVEVTFQTSHYDAKDTVPDIILTAPKEALKAYQA